MHAVYSTDQKSCPQRPRHPPAHSLMIPCVCWTSLALHFSSIQLLHCCCFMIEYYTTWAALMLGGAMAGTPAKLFRPSSSYGSSHLLPPGKVFF